MGITKLIVFFTHFKVDILNFLDFSEIITSFLDYIIIGIYFLIYFLILSAAYYGKDLALKQIKGTRRNWLRLMVTVFILSISVFYLIIIVQNISRDFSGIKFLIPIHLFESFLGLIFAFFLFALTFYFGIKGIEIINKSKRKDYFYFQIVNKFFLLFAFILIILVTSSMIGFIEKENVIKGKKFIDVSFILDDKLIQGDSTHYYIGKTNNYLFFYDEEKDKTTVYPMNRIKEITF